MNAISPGFIKSPMHGEETHEALGSLHLGGHMGEMSDVAQAIVHLDFAGFVTGEILHVDGGQSTGYLDLLFQTPETTKPSHFCEGFVLYGAGTRRTVCFGETRFSGRLEFAGKFGVPQLVTINKSASYGFQWNRTRDFLRC